MSLIEIAEKYAKQEYKKNDDFHQWHHIENVQRRADEICEKLNHRDIDNSVSGRGQPEPV